MLCYICGSEDAKIERITARKDKVLICTRCDGKLKMYDDKIRREAHK